MRGDARMIYKAETCGKWREHIMYSEARAELSASIRGAALCEETLVAETCQGI